MTAWPLLALITVAAVAGCTPGRRGPAAPAPAPRYDSPESIFLVRSDTGADAPSLTRTDVGPKFPGTSIFAGTVVVAFVVGADGKAEMPTAAILESTAPEFDRAVCDFLRETRFIPGQVDGVARRTLVAMPFLFSFEGARPREPDLNRYRAFLRNTPREELFSILGSHRGCPG